MRLLLVLLILLPFYSLAQPNELLNDLLYNHQLINAEHRNVNGTYVYEIDTIDLPLLDDFSGNKFKLYNAKPGDANVTDTTFIHLYNLAITIPEPDSVMFALDTTYRHVYDTLSTGDSIVETLVPLISKDIVRCDLSAYPIVCDTVEVWPGYTLLDSSAMVANDEIDTVFMNPPDLIQDSATIYFAATTAQDTNYIWVDHYACLNTRYAIDPPTVGVATFDGLNENGYPYDFSQGANPHGIADYLTSKPIRMAQYATDSVYISFYIQPEGNGNDPEDIDSLVLEFWIPSTDSWMHIWSKEGYASDTFEYVSIKLDNPLYFQDGMKIRFRNYANLSGNLDHWNLDYVYLNNNRGIQDSIRPDLAFVYSSDGLLNEYTAMPWKHYKWDPDFYTVDTSYATVYNLNTVAEDLFDGDLDMKFNGTVVDNTPLVSLIANVGPRVQEVIPYTKSLIEFDTTLDDTCAIFTICHSIETDDQYIYKSNDTIRYEQRFENYYAYDDGSAEAAYGPYGGGAMLAYQFEVQQQDSLRSVLMHFSPSVNDVSQNLFRLTVWADNAGKPGSILYQTPALQGESPIYTNEKNGFAEYFFLNDERIPVNGIYYVGWVQSDPDALNIGFDRNIDNSDHIFYNTSGFWTNTSFQGSLLIRPVFVSDKDALLYTQEIKTPKLKIYPNPVSDVLFIEGVDERATYLVRDITGRAVLSGQNQGKIDMSSLTAGIYVLSVEYGSTGLVVTSKFIKK